MGVSFFSEKPSELLKLKIERALFQIRDGIHKSKVRGEGPEFRGFKPWDPSDNPARIDYPASYKTSPELDEVVVSSDRLQLVRIPGKYWHGNKTVGSEPSVAVYFVSKLYDANNPDEGRRPWNDSTIVPKSVNGKTNDPRVGKSWDWFASPHK